MNRIDSPAGRRDAPDIREAIDSYDYEALRMEAGSRALHRIDPYEHPTERGPDHD